jgi:hypothetical protein
MKTIGSAKEIDYQWAGITAFSGIAGFIAYGAVLSAAHTDSYAVAPAFVFAFGIAVSSIGLYHILRGAAGSPLALIAAVANISATGLLFAMLTIQMSIYAIVQQPDPALKGVWWGLDVAWDFYIGAGTILFGLAMVGRRGLGAWIGVPGVLISVLFLIFNIVTFPKPPDTAGLLDLGPLVGLWYLVVFVRVGVAAVLVKSQQRRKTAALPN